MASDPTLQIGEVKSLGNRFQRHLLGVQSARQLVSIAVSIGIGMLIFFVIVRVASGGYPPLIVILFGAIGALPVLSSTLPSRFTISTPNSVRRDEIAGFLRQKAIKSGYKREATIDGKILLQPNWPTLFVWKENTVRIERVGDSIIVTGPIMTTTILHRVALKTFGGR
jgi:hypothetical protein